MTPFVGLPLSPPTLPIPERRSTMRILRPARPLALLAAVVVLLPFAAVAPVGPLVIAAEASNPDCTPTTATFVGDGTEGTTAGRDYVVLAFKDVNGECDWQVPDEVGSVDVLVVGGGGGTGARGGGGAGAFLRENGVAVTAGNTVRVSVGEGGGAGSEASAGANGGESRFGSRVAHGGGGGSSTLQYNDTSTSREAFRADFSGGDGGSGGGGMAYPIGTWTSCPDGQSDVGDLAANDGGGRPAGTTGAGVSRNAGGDSRPICYANNNGQAALWYGGGGGGAGEPGGDVLWVADDDGDGPQKDSLDPGAGGDGLQWGLGPGSVATTLGVGEVIGDDVWFSGGGAGGGNFNDRGGSWRANLSYRLSAGPGKGQGPNSGGGGSGRSAPADGRDGVVIVRYEAPPAEITIVASDGETVGNGWAIADGVIVPSRDVSIDASVIEGYLNAAALTVRAGRIVIGASVTGANGNDLSLETSDGIVQNADTTVATTGGDISYSTSGATTGFGVDIDGDIDATGSGVGGDIMITSAFASTAAGGRAVGGDTAAITTDGDGTVAITGDATDSTRDVSAWGIQFASLTVQTERGVILIDGTGGSASSNSRGIGFENQVLKLLSDSGDITLRDRLPSGRTSYQGLYLEPEADGAIVFGAESGSSSTSDVRIEADRVNSFVSPGVDVNTSGTFTLAPLGSSFLDTIDTTQLLFDGSITGVTLGKPGNTAGITIGSATTVAGPVSVHAGTIGVDAALQASGDITLDADSGAQLSFDGAGVELNADVTSTGGDIVVTGRGGDVGGGSQFGVRLDGSTVSAASGGITLTGVGGASQGANNHGVVFDGAAEALAGSGGLEIEGSGGGSGGDTNNNDGVRATGDATMRSGAGPVTIVGQGGNGGNSEGIALRSTNTIGAEAGASNQTGPITLTADDYFFETTQTVNTTGALTIEPKSASFAGSPTAAISELSFPDIASLTLGKPGNTAGITIGSDATVAGPVTVHSDAITIGAALEATGSTVTFRGAAANDLNGTVEFSSGGSISADGLLIDNIHQAVLSNGGTVSIDTLAARGGNRLTLANDQALTLGTVDGVDGISDYTEYVVIDTASGDLTVAQPVGTSSASSGWRLRLRAGTDTAFGTASGGDVIVSGSGAFAVPDAVTQVFSGSAANSSGLSALADAETVASVAPGVAAGGVAVAYRAGPPTFSSSTTMRFGETLTLVASDPAGSTLTLSKVSGPCTLDGAEVEATGVGTCVVRATNASSLTADSTITITQAPQTLAFTSSAPASIVSGTTYTPTASATSGLAPTIAITAGETSVCTLDGGVVTFVAAGTCTLTATQTGNTNYSAASAVSQTLVAGKINQTITFAQPADRDIDAPTFTAGATVSSDRAVTYATSTSDVCSVGTSDGVITLLDVGDCTITVSSPGDASYADAPTVTRTFAVLAVAPGRTSLTSVSFGDGTLTVGFVAPGSDGGAAITAYRAVATPDGGGAAVEQDCGAVSPCTIGGLTNGTAYTVTLAARNSAGIGPASAASPAVTPASAPEAVSALSTTPGDEQLVVSWQRPLDLGGGTFTEYRVFVRESSASTWPGTAAATPADVETETVTLTGLTNGSSYDVKVVVITSVNSTEQTSNTVSTAGIPVTAPDAPTGLTVTALSTTSALVAWTAPADDGGSPITGATIVPSCTLAASTDTSCVLTGLPAGGTVNVSVTVDNLIGSSPAVTGTVTLPAPPAPPAPPPPAEESAPTETVEEGPASTGGAGGTATGGTGGSGSVEDGVRTPTVPTPPRDRPTIVPGRPFDPDAGQGARGVVGGLLVPVEETITDEGARVVAIGGATFTFLPLGARDGVFGGGTTGGAGGPAASEADEAANGLLDADGRLLVAGDREVPLQGGGLLPGSSLQVFFTGADGRAADPRELLRVPVDEDGTFAGELRAARPLDEPPLPIGRHVVQITAFDADGLPIVIEKAINIAQDAPRPELDRSTGAVPTPGPDGVAATSAGLPVALRIEVQPETRAVSAIADDWGVDVTVADGDGSTAATSDGALVSVARSGVLTASGAGFLPGSRADVWMFSDPTLLGSVVIGDDGTFVTEVTVDAQFVAVGAHTLQVQAVGTDGFVRAVSLGIEVTEDTVTAGLSGVDGGALNVLGALPPAVLALLGVIVLAVLVLLAPTVSTFRRRRDDTAAAGDA